MGGVLAKMISKKILSESLENKFGYEDPYFENIPASKLGDISSRKKDKKRRKALPPGISDHDREVLTKVKRRAYRLDMCLFSCCGIRFGWSSVIGFMPGFGDALDAFMALMVFRTCQQVEGGLPGSISLKMMINIIIDFCIGLVPVMGDICDAMFRANTRNAVVLENFLRDKGAKNLMGHSDNPAPDPSDPDRHDRREREDFSTSSHTATARAKAATQSK